MLRARNILTVTEHSGFTEERRASMKTEAADTQ